jgi:large subunit ribosomal protein L2
MGKRITQQSRGHGSLTYRTKDQAFKFRVTYPELSAQGEGQVLKLINLIGYNAPLAKIMFNGKIFYNIAAQNIQEKQKIQIGKNVQLIPGNIGFLMDFPIGTEIFNIEIFPGSGGKLVRSGGIFAKIIGKDDQNITVLMPSKNEKKFSPKIRATIGVSAGAGRVDKPFVKAGNKYHKMKAKGGRIYPKTSALKMNAVDHPFGSGRGKRIKSKIAKRNAPPGAKVGHVRPRRTGRR